MTPEEVRAMFAASVCTGALLAAAVIGCIRLLSGGFGAISDDTYSMPGYFLDMGALLLVWAFLFLMGLAVCAGGVEQKHEGGIPCGMLRASFCAFNILGQVVVYFGVTSLVLMYRHFVMYNGVKRRLAEAAMWRKASRRIDWEIGSSTHVQEIEDEYEDLKAKCAELEHGYSPYHFEVRSWKFTMAMLLVRTAAALAVSEIAVRCIGGSA